MIGKRRSGRLLGWCARTMLTMGLLPLAPAWADAPVSFVYVHGVNNHGENSQQVIYHKFNKLHGHLLRDFAEEPLTPAILGVRTADDIDASPLVFYWYEMTQSAVQAINTDLRTVWQGVPIKRKPAKSLAARVQNNLASMLQDLFWLIDVNNQVRINDRLNHFIREQVPPQNKVVLYGYSGGAIIDFHYLLNYLPFVDLYANAKKQPKISAALLSRLSDPAVRHTCLKAALNTQIARYSNDGDLLMFSDLLYQGDQGDLATSPGWEPLLAEVVEANQSLCLPPDRIKGIITFGNPTVALTVRSVGALQGELYLGMSRYLIDHGMFWLNLNRLNDPLGYSLPVEALYSELGKRSDSPLYGPEQGFLYSNVLFQNRVYFFNAHKWYLKDPMVFSNAIVKNLKEGYLQHLHTPGDGAPE